MEFATKQSQEFQEQPNLRPQGQSRQVNKVKVRRPDVNNQNKKIHKGPEVCYRCLDSSHKPDQCPFRKRSCFHCKKVGHIAKACRKKAKQRDKQSRYRQVKVVDNEHESEEPIFDIYTLNTARSLKRGSIFADVEIGAKPLK
ncbi:hypothetical protein HOLleu_23050 [Holothuria leucospilota]|uniref:CCHC-type domain-containing protein n=1 Tax=Holothuria leucospilota TaxID=206669 RepID=A0A9Q1BUA2_HOLLE|nr:hypothetical protein HOLleu_23050 [Holothuria leucospilota]